MKTWTQNSARNLEWKVQNYQVQVVVSKTTEWDLGIYVYKSNQNLGNGHTGGCVEDTNFIKYNHEKPVVEVWARDNDDIKPKEKTSEKKEHLMHFGPLDALGIFSDTHTYT